MTIQQPKIFSQNLSKRPAPPGSTPTLSTEEYLSIVRKADTAGFDGKGPADGEVSREELYNYRNKTQKSLQVINLLEAVLGAGIGKILAPLKQKFQRKMQAIDVMGDNYRRFSNPTNATYIREPGITEGTVRDIAKTDGDATSISKYDIYDMPHLNPLRQLNPLTGKEGSQDEYLNALFSGDDALAKQLREAASTLLNSDYEPESPQHDALQTQLTQLGAKDPTRFSDYAIQHVIHRGTRNSLSKLLGSLNKLGETLEEESPQYQALQARKASIKYIDKALEFQENRAGELLKVDMEFKSRSLRLLRGALDPGTKEKSLAVSSKYEEFKTLNDKTTALHVKSANVKRGTPEMASLENEIQQSQARADQLFKEYENAWRHFESTPLSAAEPSGTSDTLSAGVTQPYKNPLTGESVAEKEYLDTLFPGIDAAALDMKRLSQKALSLHPDSSELTKIREDIDQRRGTDELRFNIPTQLLLYELSQRKLSNDREALKASLNDPNSAGGGHVQSRLVSIDAIKKALDGHTQRLSTKLKMTRDFQGIFNRLFSDQTNPSSQPLRDLAKQFLIAEEGSPQKEALAAKMGGLVAASKNPKYDNDFKVSMLFDAIRYLTNVEGSLLTVKVNLSPTAPEFKHVNDRLSKIGEIKNALSGKYEEALLEFNGREP